jgi:hypothetical protein
MTDIDRRLPPRSRTAAVWARSFGAVALAAVIACVPTPGNDQRSAAPQEQTAAAANDTLWLLGHDPSADAVRASDTEQSLIARYGLANVQRAPVDEGEGMLQPGTVLFPDDSSRRLTILWHDTVDYSLPARVAIDSRSSRWHVAPGIGIGTSLAALERMNGGAFTLGGFGGHGPGSVHDWEGGRLAHFALRDGPYGWHRVELRLEPATPWPSGVDPYRYMDEGRYRSSEPGMRALAPTVASVSVWPR